MSSPTSGTGSGRPRSHSMSDFLRARQNGLPDLAAAEMITHLRNVLAEERRLEELASKLPRLTEEDLVAIGQEDSTCPICLTSLLALLAEEETALVLDSPAHPAEELGVTRLVDSCGHVFCRKDIRNWMREGHSTCPTCRRAFLPPPPPSSAAPTDAQSLTFTDPQHLPSLDEESDIAAFLRQLSIPDNFPSMARAIMGALDAPGASGASRDVGIGTEGPFDWRRGRDGEDRDGDREEDAGTQAFSGMYS